MKVLFITRSFQDCDLIQTVKTTGSDITVHTPKEAMQEDLSAYDAFALLSDLRNMDARLRVVLDAEAENGKRFFAEAIGSFFEIYSAPPKETTRSRLIVLKQPEEYRIPGLEEGDLLDDESNQRMQPYVSSPDIHPILVYRDHIIAHRHTDMTREEIMKDSSMGMWRYYDHILMTSFLLHNFNRARFAPRVSWQKLIAYVVAWLTGEEPKTFPEPVVRFGSETPADLTDRAVFDRCRRETVSRGLDWMKRYLVDEGKGGILEGLCHAIDPEGKQSAQTEIRTDCTGEAAGAFRFGSLLTGREEGNAVADSLHDFVYDPMVIHKGQFAGMMRWTASAWAVCYQDDNARAMLPALYDWYFRGDDRHASVLCEVLDFLVKTTAKDGLRPPRTDNIGLHDKEQLASLGTAEHGYASAHYNAYYHAALLMGYLCTGRETYLATARAGLESLMAVYPDTKREQSETEEMCRLVLPLALLFKATGKEGHKEMLYRVAGDLQRVKDSCGGYKEWDTGYKANCSRESMGECSVLTENGDPVVDLLYSVNWLPLGFAMAYYATRDPWFETLWREVCAFCMRTQVISENPMTNGSWCRAFDIGLWEAYACPHDAGWAACCSESGWTNAEILMGLSAPEFFAQKKD